jgi:hypothetical protein
MLTRLLTHSHMTNIIIIYIINTIIKSPYQAPSTTQRASAEQKTAVVISCYAVSYIDTITNHEQTIPNCWTWCSDYSTSFIISLFEGNLDFLGAMANKLDNLSSSDVNYLQG